MSPTERQAEKRLEKKLRELESARRVTGAKFATVEIVKLAQEVDELTDMLADMRAAYENS